MGCLKGLGKLEQILCNLQTSLYLSRWLLETSFLYVCHVQQYGCFTQLC